MYETAFKKATWELVYPGLIAMSESGKSAKQIRKCLEDKFSHFKKEHVDMAMQCLTTSHKVICNELVQESVRQSRLYAEHKLV